MSNSLLRAACCTKKTCCGHPSGDPYSGTCGGHRNGVWRKNPVSWTLKFTDVNLCSDSDCKIGSSGISDTSFKWITVPGDDINVAEGWKLPVVDSSKVSDEDTVMYSCQFNQSGWPLTYCPFNGGRIQKFSDLTCTEGRYYDMTNLFIELDVISSRLKLESCDSVPLWFFEMRARAYLIGSDEYGGNSYDGLFFEWESWPSSWAESDYVPAACSDFTAKPNVLDTCGISGNLGSIIGIGGTLAGTKSDA